MVFRFGPIEVQPATQQLLIAGTSAALGGRAFDLLLALIERRHRLVPKHELLDIVWRGQVVEESNLHVHVSALRKLLGPAAITTIPGRGFRFVAALEGAEGADSAPGADGTQGPQAGSATTLLAATPSEPIPPVPGNLAAKRPPLLGREAELPALLALVQAHRLVTIVGASGMGKTALAQAAAQALRAHWRDGAWWVDLATVSDPALLPQAVAQALQISPPARPDGRSTADHLVGVLASMSLLLVLDNCEHLVDAAGAFAERIVNHASGVHVLATSQELLNVANEALFKLAPLSLPAADDTLEVTRHCGAVRLFVERARAADVQFTLSAENTAAVVDICRRLDGLPLAIELAAARVRLLGVHGLCDKLGERFRILTGGARTAMRRHQTLRAALDWSHALLSGTEQVVLRRLGVFVGGFALELAQEVAQDERIDEWAALDALVGLVDKSLVIADATDLPRYRLLETTRAYALEMLAAAGETDAWIERHARVIFDFFERSEDAYRGEQGTLTYAEFTRRTVPELDNARAALAWAGGEVGGCGVESSVERSVQRYVESSVEGTGQPGGDLNLAIGLAGASAPVFAALSLSVEAADRLMRLRGWLDGPVSPHGAALFRQGLAVLGQSSRLPLAVALEAADRAEQFYRAQHMPKRLHLALARKALLLTLAGDCRAAQALVPAMHALEAPSWAAGRIGRRLRVQGWIALAQGELEKAMTLFTAMRTLQLGESGDGRGLIESETELCRCLWLAARHDECIALARSVVAREGLGSLADMPRLARCLMAAQAMSGRRADAGRTLVEALPGWRRNGVFGACGAMAVVLAELGAWADAARLGAASIAFLRRAQIVWHASSQRTDEYWQALLAAAGCAPDDLARWQREGEALDEAAVEAICLRAVQAAD